MHITLEWTLKTAAFAGFLYILLSLFNVHWLMRLRILGAMGVGGFLIGFLLWPKIAPIDPLGAVTLYNGAFSLSDILLCMLASLLAGAGGYLIAYPYGKAAGLLSVPTGLAVWTFQSGSVRSLLLTHSAFEERLAVYRFLRIETIFWLAMLLCGAAGIWILSRFLPPKKTLDSSQASSKTKRFPALSILIAVLASVVIVQLTIGLFAQDVRYPDTRIGSVTGQPGNRQIAFAVLASFALAGAVIKYFLDCEHYWAVLSAPLLYAIVISVSCSPQMLQYMTENWAVTYFPNTITAILPVQFISFSAIGALAGQWLIIKYKSAKKLQEVL
ncbi:MAG TPA: hypothetical protein PKY88_04840 [Anaerohalosphaeraceae bacterium]|nr:hypothetical protein [Anaerohalosphaeraceae bacterium]